MKLGFTYAPRFLEQHMANIDSPLKGTWWWFLLSTFFVGYSMAVINLMREM
jgi:hypothetical protein